MDPRDLTLDGMELQACERCHCVGTVAMHHLTLHHDLPGSFIRSVIWHDPRSYLEIDLPWSKYVGLVYVSRRIEYNDVRQFSPPFLVIMLFAKSLILPKSNIFCLICPGYVKTWPNQIGYGWIQNIPSVPFFFVTRICCNLLLDLLHTESVPQVCSKMGNHLEGQVLVRINTH